MIWNRPPNLWLGAFTAVFNVAVLVLAAQGAVVSAELVAAVNIAAGAVITLAAFQPPSVNVGDAVHVMTPHGEPTITRVMKRQTDGNRPVAVLERADDVVGDALTPHPDDPGPAGPGIG